jgi:hypothetical protein
MRREAVGFMGEWREWREWSGVVAIEKRRGGRSISRPRIAWANTDFAKRPLGGQALLLLW